MQSNSKPFISQNRGALFLAKAQRQISQGAKKYQSDSKKLALAEKNYDPRNYTKQH